MRFDVIFSITLSDEIIRELEDYKIKYSVTGHIVVFHIYRDQDCYEYFAQKYSKAIGVTLLKFSKKELLNTEWLVVNPIYNKVSIINEDEAFSYSCNSVNSYGVEFSNHRDQRMPIQIRGDITWKKRFFLAADTGYGEIFVNNHIVKLVNDGQISGCRFDTVYDRKGFPCENTLQLIAEDVIPDDCIALNHGERRLVCPDCGRIQYEVGSSYQLHLFRNKLNSEKDIFMTRNIFGSGQAHALVVISNRFYRVLSENQMCDWHVIPAVLV